MMIFLFSLENSLNFVAGCVNEQKGHSDKQTTGKIEKIKISHENAQSEIRF